MGLRLGLGLSCARGLSKAKAAYRLPGPKRRARSGTLSPRERKSRCRACSRSKKTSRRLLSSVKGTLLCSSPHLLSTHREWSQAPWESKPPGFREFRSLRDYANVPHLTDRQTRRRRRLALAHPQPANLAGCKGRERDRRRTKRRGRGGRDGRRRGDCSSRGCHRPGEGCAAL